jgi:hypothetical protein
MKLLFEFVLNPTVLMLLLKLPRSVGFLREVGFGIFIKICLLNESNEFLWVKERKSQKTKKVNEIFIGENSIINPLKGLIKIDCLQKRLFVCIVLKALNYFLNCHFFFIILIDKIKSLNYLILVNWLKLSFERVYKLSIVYLIGIALSELLKN